MSIAGRTALPAAILACVLAAGGCSPQRDTPETRVIVIGLDGLELRVLNELIDRGRLPAFQRIMEDGLWGELQSYKPILSPLIWTTMATGRTPDQHGVLNFTSYDDCCGTMLVPSSRRQCAGLWNIATHFGLSSTVIGWWATWPAEEIDGYIVSDRFVRTAFGADPETQVEPETAVTFPESLYDQLSGERISRESIGYEACKPYLNVDRVTFQQQIQQSFNLRNPYHHLQLILARTETYRRVLLRMLDEQPTDICLAYFEFTDSMGHLFMPYRPPRQEKIGEEDFARFSGAVDAAYETADGILGDVLERLGPRDMLIVVSDHGFYCGEDRPQRSALTTTDTAVLWHRLEGTILAYGHGIQPARIEGASVVDVAPTVLTLAGIPLSGELPGKPLPELLKIRGIEPGGIARVDRYDVDYTPPELPDAAGEDPEEVERLEALGYLGGGTGDNESAAEAVEHFNLAIFYDERDQTELALKQLDQALELSPEHDRALGRKCELLVRLDRLDEAGQAIQSLLPRLENEMRSAKVELAKVTEDGGPPEERVRWEENLNSTRLQLAATLNHEGDLHYKRQSFARAVESFSRSIELDPSSPETLYNLGTCFGISSRYQEAVVTLERLLRMDPGHVKGRQSIAVASIRLGEGNRARSHLESLIEDGYETGNLFYLMGESYRVTGDETQAGQWYTRALQKEPQLKKAQARLDELKDAN